MSGDAFPDNMQMDCGVPSAPAPDMMDCDYGPMRSPEPPELHQLLEADRSIGPDTDDAFESANSSFGGAPSQALSLSPTSSAVPLRPVAAAESDAQRYMGWFDTHTAIEEGPLTPELLERGVHFALFYLAKFQMQLRIVLAD